MYCRRPIPFSSFDIIAHTCTSTFCSCVYKGGNIKLLLLEEPPPSFLRNSKILPMVGYGYFRKSPIAESTYYKINIKHFTHPTNWDYIGPQPHVNCYNNICSR